MLDTELIDLLNSRSLWGFFGSGTSVDSGLPNWRNLVTRILDTLDAAARTRIEADAEFTAAMMADHYPRALGIVDEQAGRKATVQGLLAALAVDARPGLTTQTLARWPFKGYVTTNYDALLETALSDINIRDWTSLGNNAGDSRMTTRAARDVVWHLHGGVNVADTSRFILTERDYEEFYVAGSPYLENLRSLLLQQRTLFVGFGFSDHDLMKQLELVGSLCNPAQPAFAFVPDTIRQSDRNRLFDAYNVKSIVYPNSDRSHKGLATLMKVYESFVVLRTFSFSNTVRRTPSHDPETTSLFLYNELVMKRTAPLEDKVLLTLTKARVLATLQYRPKQSASDLTAELEAKLATLSSDTEFSPIAFQETLQAALAQLSTDRLIEAVSEDCFALTEGGLGEVENRQADARLMEKGFMSALSGRVSAALPDAVETTAVRVRDVSYDFFLECVRTRAVGVAKSLFKTSESAGDFQVLSLLAALPLHMKQLADADEALGLVRVVTDVLSHPTDKEREFLGASIQAHFALVVMGYDPEALKARIRLMSEVAFVFDAPTLISLLARGSAGNRSSTQLLALAQRVGATTLCTGGLVNEVAEHAQWVRYELGQESLLSGQTLRTVLGSSGSRTNLFLEGIVNELSGGANFTSFDEYLNLAFGSPRGNTCKDDVVKSALNRCGVPSFEPQDFEGFDPTDLADEEEIMNQIEERRRARDTFTHTRQVKTEARVVVLVKLLRSGKYRISGTKYADAFFVSNSRVVDRLKDSTTPMTMTPSALNQWLLTLNPCDPRELALLSDALILELDQRGYSIVDKATVQTVFSPLIDLSREKLNEEIEKNRTLTASMYGQDSLQAFAEVKSTEIPLVLNSLYEQRARKAEKDLEGERSAKERAQKTKSLTDREREELALLRAAAKQRKAEARAKKRAASSKRSRRKKR